MLDGFRALPATAHDDQDDDTIRVRRVAVRSQDRGGAGVDTVVFDATELLAKVGELP